MILNLPTKKKWHSGYIEEPIDIMIRIGTLEDICDTHNIKLKELQGYVSANNYDFNYLLLWGGYLTACQKKYKRPKYTEDHALIWHERMSLSERKRFNEELNSLYGKIIDINDNQKGKKKVNRQTLTNSDVLRSENSAGR